jgi:hypothetical protein
LKTIGFPMKFVLVNHRIPLDDAICAGCSGALRSGYLKAVSTRRQYCDLYCYRCDEARASLLNLSGAISFEMMTLVAVASCCYSIAIAGAALRVGELMTSEISGGHRKRGT